MQMKGHTYRLFKKGDEVRMPSLVGEAEDYCLCIEMTKEGGEKCYVGTDITFDRMLKLMETVSEEDLVGIAGSTVLTEIAKESRHG